MGACAGSTTGGIKSIRLVILAKVSRNEFKHHTSQRRASGTGKQTGYLLHTFYRVSIHFLVYRTNYRRHIGNARVRSRPDGIIGCTISSLKHGTVTRPVWSCLYSWNELPDAAKWLMSFLCCSDVSSYLRFYYYSAPISGKELI